MRPMRWEHYQFQQPIRGQTWGQVISLNQWEASLPRIAGREELFCQGIAISEVLTKLLLQLRGHCLDSRGGCVHHDRGQEYQHTQQTGDPAVTIVRYHHCELNQRFIPTTDSSKLTRTFELRLSLGGSRLFCLKNCEGQAREMCESFFFKFETFSSQIFTFTIYLLLFHHGKIDNRMGTSPHGTPADMLLGNVLTIWQKFLKSRNWWESQNFLWIGQLKLL